MEASKLQFLIKKRYITISAAFFFLNFGHQNPGSGLDPGPDSIEMLDPDPDSMDLDPQHCIAGCSETVRITPVFVSQALKRNCQALRRKAKETEGLKQCRVCLDNVDSKRCSGIYSVHVFIGISYYCTVHTSLCSFDVEMFSSCFTCLFSNPESCSNGWGARLPYLSRPSPQPWLPSPVCRDSKDCVKIFSRQCRFHETFMTIW
jgi:hypothetical protein